MTDYPRPEHVWTLPLRKHVVYGLTDPDGSIRYIGSTISPRTRIKQHVYCGWRQANTARPIANNAGLYRWIGDLLKRGECFGVVFLADNARVESEIALIHAHLEAGAALLNRELYTGGAICRGKS